MKGDSGFSKALIDWYEEHQRDLPWNNTSNPYFIWVSEIILQQTQVQQGLPFYERFIERFPDVRTLAEANPDDVLKIWEGLGYYSRARNLHKGARYVLETFNGRLPSTREELLTIPGIGPYTSAAIAAFAFGRTEAAIDGNLMRVLTRVHVYPGDITKVSTRKTLEEMALQDMGNADPAEFNRAMMDLGSSICRSTRPLCEECPVKAFCEAYHSGQVSDFPFSTKKISKQKRFLHYLLSLNDSGTDLAYRQRDDKGIWKGLYELPLIETDIQMTIDVWEADEPARRVEVIDTRKHILTHRHLEIKFYRYTGQKIPKELIIRTLEKVAFPVAIRDFLRERL